jgi:hypothetical protein
MAKPKADQIEDTKRLMGALVRMRPKPHEDMKLGPKKSMKKKKPSKKD